MSRRRRNGRTDKRRKRRATKGEYMRDRGIVGEIGRGTGEAVGRIWAKYIGRNSKMRIL